MANERERNTAFYIHEQVVADVATGEIVSSIQKTITKTSAEPDFIKVYYETMMAFNQIHNVPVQFVLSLSKFLEWSNDGNPQYVTINKRIKEVMMTDCEVSLAQLDRYIKKSVNNGLLFRTQYRGVYEVNPFMIAKGKWESIRKLRAEYDFKNGSWQRKVEFDKKDTDDDSIPVISITE